MDKWPERTRSRFEIYDDLIGRKTYYKSVPEKHRYLLVDRQTTIDEVHPWHTWQKFQKILRSQGRSVVSDVGGEFTTVKTTARITSNPNEVGLSSFPNQGDHLYKWQGPLIPSRPLYSAPAKDVKEVIGPTDGFAQVSTADSAIGTANNLKWVPLNGDEEELMTLGASLLGKLSPTAPHNNVYTSLGELRNDGLPNIPLTTLIKNRGKKGIGADLGDEWLNVQFAIAPTISDVKSIAETVQKADKLWRQYLRDSGRLVRRRADMDPVVTTTQGMLYDNAAYIPWGTWSHNWSSVGPTYHTTTTTVKRSFSGAYMYYVSKESLRGLEEFAQKAQHLYGWKPSPTGMYNLTAWSWLLDWFTNTGDVVDNVSLYLEDPFLVRWAYMMEETHQVRDVEQVLKIKDGPVVYASMRFETLMKKRRKINPLHFGLKEEALDARQLSILAALGLTRGRDPGLM